MPLQRAVGMVLSFQTPPVKLGGLWLHGYDATWFLRHPGLLVPRRAYGKRVALGRIEVLAQPISDERKTKDAQRGAEPGEDPVHHCPVIIYCEPVAMIEPHSGVGGRMPAPM